MELVGNITEETYVKNSVFDTEDLRNIYLKNTGSAPVTFGQITLQSNQEHTINTGGVTLKAAQINIVFNKEISDDTQLYIRATKVLSTKCRKN